MSSHTLPYVTNTPAPVWRHLHSFRNNGVPVINENKSQTRVDITHDMKTCIPAALRDKGTQYKVLAACYYMSYWAGLAAIQPYFNLYFESKGVSSAQIGA